MEQEIKPSNGGTTGKRSKVPRLSRIRNKVKRNAEWSVVKREKRKIKKEAQNRRKNEALNDPLYVKPVPKTIENTREKDETTIDNTDEEVLFDINHDDYEDYFKKIYEPKVLITSSDNPHTKTNRFIRELTKIVPNSECYWRKRSSVKKMVKKAPEKGFTDVIIINEDNRTPNGILVSHLPNGPSAYFKISNLKLTKDMKHKNTISEFTSHRPEVVLNNFTTRLGQTVSRMLASLFHYDPQFKGRRAVTFHNQRDYIFFRHHRYEFKSEKKVALRELGPRFTLRLKWLQKGTFDTIEGDFEWVVDGHRREIETSRRKFSL